MVFNRSLGFEYEILFTINVGVENKGVHSVHYPQNFGISRYPYSFTEASRRLKTELLIQIGLSWSGAWILV